jgi:mannose-6-phosphate isomerase-like protein (cupin superfamily)
VQTGSIVYVGAEVEHKFHSITEDLKALVFFEPAEGS